ncbi:MAG TPA: ABC transporter permease [Nitrososphaerales archaeon]|nr:ABC transporter permease [Nitrososphaerales archaeon]
MKAVAILKSKWIVRAYVLALALAVWQVLGQSVNPIIFATPAKTAATFVRLWSDGTLPSETTITLETVFAGFLLSAAVAIPIGLVMGRIRLVEYAVDPYVNFVYATPLVAIIPIALIWFGPTNVATYFIILLHTAPPILINTMAGVKNTERTMVETGRSFGFGGLRLWQKVVLPSSLPYIMAGLRIGIGAALIGTMVAEIFLYNTGLGYVLVNETALFNSAAVISAVLIIMALGVILAELAKWIDRRFLSWAGGASGLG